MTVTETRRGHAHGRGIEAHARPSAETTTVRTPGTERPDAGNGRGPVSAAEGTGHAEVAALLGRLISDVGRDAVERHLCGGSKVRRSAAGFEVVARTAFEAQMIRRRLGGALDAAARGEAVSYAVEPESFAVPGRGRPEASERAAARGGRSPGRADDRGRSVRSVSGTVPSSGVAERRRGGGWQRPSPRREHRMETFVVGRSNRMAYRAAECLANPDDPTAGTLFLHGACGVGKTHLLRAIASRYLRARPNSVRFTTAEAFTAEYVDAVRSGSVAAFQRRYRAVELLCIDDVHFLASKAGTQNELVHTFDAIRAAGRRVALASDEHPRRIAKLSAALVSRLVSGPVMAIEPPDESLRAGILSELAGRAGLAMTDAAISLAAGGGGFADGSAVLSVRDLEGIVTQVGAVAQLNPELCESGGVVGVAAVEHALRARRHTRSGATRILGGDETPAGWAAAGRPPVRVEKIAAAACGVLGVDPSELAGRRRHKKTVLAREVTAYLARRLTTRSYPEIAAAMGRTAHSSIVEAASRFGARLERGDRVDVGCSRDGLTLREFAEDVAAQIG